MADRTTVNGHTIEPEADLTDANLQDANLRDADLWDADLRDADLRDANLRYANLWYANLRGANLRDADLWNVDLRDANLRGADLRGVNLQSANLRGADLRDADLPMYQIVPEVGQFVAYKKTRDHIVRLVIPDDAERTSSLIGRKCRASKAYVDEILDMSGESCDVTMAYSRHDSDFVYEEGETVEPDKYDDDIRVECSNGIHFFVTKQEAIDW